MENRKKQYSCMVIEGVFVELLRKKPLEKITVVEICKLANVNRSTFYANYLDIYDLMDHVADKSLDTLFSQCVDKMGEPNPAGVARKGMATSRELIREALLATLEQRDLYRLLIKSGRVNFEKKLLDSLLEWSQARYLSYTGAKSDTFYLEYTMLLGGVIILWQKWIETDFKESPELLTEVIDHYILENVKRIWEKPPPRQNTSH